MSSICMVYFVPDPAQSGRNFQISFHVFTTLDSPGLNFFLAFLKDLMNTF